MPKAQTQYRFRLSKVKRSAWLEADYSPVKALEGTALIDYSVVPTFNNDRFFFSPAFKLPFDSKFDAEQMM